jgi:hypothetical protein
VELYWQGKTSDLSTRALWQSYQQSQLVTKQEELGKGNYELCRTSKGVEKVTDGRKCPRLCISIDDPLCLKL